MTSEVVVMNSLAVALATDSAATVSSGNDHKVYKSVDKLFMLSKRHPVGVMVHNNASLLGIPWQTILKIFRETLGTDELPSLIDYGKALIQYLNKNDHLFPWAAQKHFYLQMLETLYRGIHTGVTSRVIRELQQGKKPDREAIAHEMILEAHKDWEKEPAADCFDSDVGKELVDSASPDIHDLTTRSFPNLKLRGETVNALRDLATFAISKRRIVSETISGLVIAGFGKGEYFPVMKTYELGEVYMGQLKYQEMHTERISVSNRSFVKPFAHSDRVDTFLSGISPRFELRMVEEIVNLALRLPDEVIDAITDLSARKRQQWKERVRVQSEEAVTQIVERFADHRLKGHLAPIYEAITNSPKDELAQIAAWLVNLNSQQKRMSMGPETVGGPIDVAVISKGDGFIWIDRKHYFRPELNHHFFRNYDAKLLRGHHHDKETQSV